MADSPKEVTERRTIIDYVIAQMKIERSSFWTHWHEIAEVIAPTRPRFLVTETNRGHRVNQEIVDSTGLLASRTLRSGMMSGITSPARPWFKLATLDLEDLKLGPNKEWLETVTKLMSTAFVKSNIYNVLPLTYGDLANFGTAAMFVEEEENSIFRAYSLPIGSFYLAADDTQQIRTYAREFRMTVRQVVDQFGLNTNGERFKTERGTLSFENLSIGVKNLYTQGNLEAWIDVTHFIQSNPKFDPKKLESKFKEFESVYFETGQGNTTLNRQTTVPDKSKFLKHSGFDYFPVLAPRWALTGNDIYGTNCPGMEALGDIRQLQLGERRLMQAIDKIVNPPMQGPSQLKQKHASILPGDITYVDVREGQRGFAPTYQVPPGILEMENKQQQVRERISRIFYEDLFLMLSNLDRKNITATEIDARYEEKLLALGPVLEQINQDLLDPLINITFNIMNKAGLIPPAPEGLQGQELKVDYVSIMAQAQKSVGISNVERFVRFTGGLAELEPSVLMKLDFDNMVDEYAEMINVPASIVRSEEQVAEFREAAAAQQAQQQQLDQVEQGSQIAKNLGSLPPEDRASLEEAAQQQPDLQLEQGGLA